MNSQHLNQGNSTNDSTGAIIHQELTHAFSNHSLGKGLYSEGQWEITITNPESFYLFEVDLASIIAHAVNHSIKPSGNGEKYTVPNPFPSLTYHMAWHNLENRLYGEELTFEDLQTLVTMNKSKPIFVVSPPRIYAQEFDPSPYEPKFFSQKIELVLPGIGIVGEGGKVKGQYKFSLNASKLEQYITQAYN